MESKDVLVKLREQRGLSQQELADQLHVTRQAVSRWERGETTPNPETLKQLSALLHVSINTLLGVPRQLVCQSCGREFPRATASILVRHPVRYRCRCGGALRRLY